MSNQNDNGLRGQQISSNSKHGSLSLKWSKRLADLIKVASEKMNSPEQFAFLNGIDMDTYNKFVSGDYNFTLEELSLIESNMKIDVSEAVIGDTLIFQSPIALDIMSGSNTIYEKVFNIKIGIVEGGNGVHMSCPELKTWAKHRSLVHILNSMANGHDDEKNVVKNALEFYYRHSKTNRIEIITGDEEEFNIGLKFIEDKNIPVEYVGESISIKQSFQGRECTIIISKPENQ